MTQTAFDVITRLAGKTLASAESITAGGIGAALTAVPGASAAYKGGIISYCDEVKANLLAVPTEYLTTYGAVSAPVAEAMAQGARKALRTDLAVAVTGLAGPTGDDFGHSVGTVYIGFADRTQVFAREYHFDGDREAVRTQTIEAALRLILENV
jgi:nicotinamide-nucleotide amidase